MNNSWKGLPLVIFGVGGFSKEVKTLVDDINASANVPIFDLIGYVSHSIEDVGNELEGLQVVTTNDKFEEFAKQYKILGVTIALGNPKFKESIDTEILSKCSNLVYPNLIHPKANITSSLTNDFGQGNIICAGVTVTTNIKFGKFTIVNINSTIGHDAVIEDYCTINPLVAISGNVIVRKGSLVGAGASILEKLEVGPNSIVGLGAIAVKNVERDTVVICKAAHKLEK